MIRRPRPAPRPTNEKRRRGSPMTARRPLRSLLAVSLAALAAAGALFAPAPGAAQEPLRIEITEGVIEPMPIAIPAFAAR